MPTYIIVVLRTAEGMLGLVLLYGAFFLHEDEENKIQDKLAELWIRAQDARSDSSSINRFIRECARLSHQALKRIFGEHIFSVRAFGVSFCGSIASYLLVMRFPHTPNSDLAWAVFCILTGTLAATYPNRCTSLLALALPAACLVYRVAALAALPVDRMHFEVSSATFVLVFIVSCGLDFLWVALNREFMRLAVERHWTIPMAVGLLVSGVVFATPFLPFISNRFPDYVYNSNALYNFSLFFSVLLSTRLLIMFAAGIFFLSIGSALLYLCFRPVLTRAVYAAQRHALIRSHKKLGTVGAALFADALPFTSWTAWLAHIVQHAVR